MPDSRGAGPALAAISGPLATKEWVRIKEAPVFGIALQSLQLLSMQKYGISSQGQAQCCAKSNLHFSKICAGHYQM